MADATGWFGRPSLRRRFAAWFGTLFVLGAVALRLSHYHGMVDAFGRDLDVQLWSRLATVKAQERFAPDSLLDTQLRQEGIFLRDLPAAADRGAPWGGWIPAVLREPEFDAAECPWFAGVWRRDGTLVDDVDLPGGFSWEAGWLDRLDTIWTSADGRHRLAATAGAHDTVLVAGTPVAPLAAAARRAAGHQILSFVVWVPVVLGIAWLALSRLLVPLAAIAATARRIRAGRFAERIDTSRTDAEFTEAAVTLNDMLDRLDEIRGSQSRFNADVAHQLMNPVHAILLEADAATQAPRSADDLQAALGRVGGLAGRIESICEALLAYARSAAIDPARLERVDLEPVIAAAIDRVGPQAEVRGVAIEPPPEGAVVRGDPGLLEEVFANLLGNAIEHSVAGGHVEIVAHEAAGRSVAVVDHGRGVAAADVPRLFERFHSGKAAGGHGIGLALSRRIMRSHGGDLVHEPTPGGGATFTLRFPAGV